VTRSLRFRLTATVVSVLVLVLVGVGLLLDAFLARALRRQFDARLLGDATAIAGMAEDEAGAAEFEYASLPEFEGVARPAYFQAWLDDGRVLARSLSLGAGDLPRAGPTRPGPTYFDAPLPDGRAGRAVELRQPLRVDPPVDAAGVRRVPFQSVSVVVARSTEELWATSAELRWCIGLLLAVALPLAALITGVAVARSLRSTRALAAEIATLGPERLELGIARAYLPTELVPIADKLEELLSRVARSIEREKRFTADVSHELRTPLAALRTMLEVTASRERPVEEYRRMTVEASAVIDQMQSLCETLLALARHDGGAKVGRETVVALRPLVDDSWLSHAPAARARGLVFRNVLPADAICRTDAEHLRLILSNLLSNAVRYTERGGVVTVGPSGPGGAVVLEVRDSGPPIPEAVLPHVFERFFRGDATRSEGGHSGIGLALVRSVARTLGLDVRARNTREGEVVFEIVRGG
jgi:signal transduction histidine kinase